jgi:hypothetical protein
MGRTKEQWIERTRGRRIGESDVEFLHHGHDCRWPVADRVFERFQGHCGYLRKRLCRAQPASAAEGTERRLASTVLLLNDHIWIPLHFGPGVLRVIRIEAHEDQVILTG